MAFLGLDIIISSNIWIIVAFYLLYHFRRRIFKSYYEKKDSNLPINKIKQYLKLNHPKIKFSYKVLDDIKDEQSSQSQIISAIDNLVIQFINFHIDTKSSNTPISQNQLWDSYTFNSKPNGNKLPTDWAQRKAVVLQRDKHICQRCGQKLKVENAQLYIIKPIKDGGQYYLENLLILCRDCEKITSKQDVKYLDIKDELNSFIK